MTPSIRGVRSPTFDERALAAAADGLTLDKSLERVDTTARYVFVGITGAATIFSGFGLLADVRTALDQGPHVADVPLPVLLVVGAVLLSTYAITPRLRTLQRQSLEAVASFYRRQIWRRGLSATLAMVLLAAALAVSVAIAANQDAPDRRLSLSAIASGNDARRSMSALATVGHLETRDVLRLRATVTTTRGRRLTVCQGQSGPNAAGVATIRCPAARLPTRSDRVRVVGSVHRPGEKVERDVLVLRP